MLQYPLAVSNNTSKQLCNVGRCHVDRCNLSIHLSHIILYLTISIFIFTSSLLPMSLYTKPLSFYIETLLMESGPTKTSGNQLEPDGSQMIPRCRQMLPAAPPRCLSDVVGSAAPSWVSAVVGGPPPVILWAPRGRPGGPAQLARNVHAFFSHSVQMWKHVAIMVTHYFRIFFAFWPLSCSHYFRIFFAFSSTRVRDPDRPDYSATHVFRIYFALFSHLFRIYFALCPAGADSQCIPPGSRGWSRILDSAQNYIWFSVGGVEILDFCLWLCMGVVQIHENAINFIL